MGTSTSSSGPVGGVSLVPPWVEAPEDNSDGSSNGETTVEQPVNDESESSPASKDPLTPLAPPARFSEARRAIGAFARSGSPSKMYQGLRHYVSKGLGGGRTASRRMSKASSRAGSLYGALRDIAGVPQNDTLEKTFDVSSLAGKSADEVIDAIIDFVSPLDGSQDAESSQHAISEALADFIDEHKDISLSSLSVENIDWIIERHLVYEILNRVQLDIGKSILERAPNAVTAVQRLNDIKEYVEETVAVSFREHRLSRGKEGLTNGQATKIAQQVIEETFFIFEGYVK